MAQKSATPATPKGLTHPAAATQDAASLHLSLPQMLDLALGTPEVGAVNLNILHNFLHVVLHQINLRTTKVEYRGEDANRIKTMVKSSKDGPSLHLHEYAIIGGSGKVKQRINSSNDLTVKVDVFTEERKTHPTGKDAKGGKPPASAPVTARGKAIKDRSSNTSFDEAAAGAKVTKGVKHQLGGNVDENYQSVIFVEPVIDGTAPTALAFKHLEETIKKLQQNFQALEELATNNDMIERIKSSSTDPLSDMWHAINVTKRLDAAEEGISKLTTMVQDLIKSDKMPVGEENNDFSATLSTIENRLAELESYMTRRQSEGTKVTAFRPSALVASAVSSPPGTRDAGGPTIAGEVRDAYAKGDLSDIHGEISNLKNEVTQIHKQIFDLDSKITQSVSAKVKTGVAGSGISATVVVDAGVKNLPNSSEGAESTAPNQNLRIENIKEVDPASVETKITQCLDMVQNMAAMYGDTIHDLTNRVQNIEKDVGCLLEKANSVPMAGVSPEGLQGFNDLVAKIQAIQGEMEQMNEASHRLMNDRENRDINSNALLEQIELLKTIKADKEDLEDALADKADTKAVNRKVSYDQFDAACDDLARGLENAIVKLSQQESIWQQALNEVQREIEGKLDKMEISPLKEFVNSKLKLLQEKLKSLSEMRRESEAAGTKKLLRDVQCLSCDKNVVMKMQENVTFHAEPMTCTRSIKPYLTYELDQVRKQQRRLPYGKSMIQFEAVIQEETRKHKVTKDDSLVKSPRDHLCNRYCGGSHTVTTPHQRVMRTGHFLNQWGPEAVQLTEGTIRGSDGRLYRSRAVLEKADVCGPCGSESERITASEPVASRAELPPTNYHCQTSQRKISSIEQRLSNTKKLVPAESAPEASTIAKPIVEELPSIFETKDNTIVEQKREQDLGEAGIPERIASNAEASGTGKDAGETAEENE